MYEALVAVQKIRDPSVGTGYRVPAEGSGRAVQLVTVETTGILRNRAAAPQLRDVLEHTKSAKVRRAALTALSRLGDPADHPLFLRFFPTKMK
jgi:hypothetical protein